MLGLNLDPVSSKESLFPSGFLTLIVNAASDDLWMWIVQVGLLLLINEFGFPWNPREVIQPEVMEEMVVSCVIKHLNLVDALQSLINFQYQEEHAEEYDLLCKIMGETFKKLNAMERQLQVKRKLFKTTEGLFWEKRCILAPQKYKMYSDFFF